MYHDSQLNAARNSYMEFSKITTSEGRKEKSLCKVREILKEEGRKGRL